MANIMLKRGICLYNVGKYSESIEQMDQLIKVGKHFMSEAYCYKAMCYEKSSKWDDVITFASKSIQLNPNLLESFQVRAKAYEMVSLHDLAEHDRDRQRMSFSFNFQIPGNETPSSNIQTEPSSSNQSNNSSINESNVGEILIHQAPSLPKTTKLEKLSFSKATLNRYVLSQQLLDSLCPTLSQVTNTSDLSPSFYEGGFKLWECSIDLIGYLNDISEKEHNFFHQKSVLEIGCGHGLPGIYCIHAGSRVVHFQDYNSEVLQFLTAPNILLNKSHSENTTEIKLFYGDWGKFCETSSTLSQYDLVLTSDTIYNPGSILKLYSMIKSTLKKDTNSVALVACKSYYFGVGGGSDQLKEIVKNDSQMSIECLERFEDGLSNIREIWGLKWLL